MAPFFLRHTQHLVQGRLPGLRLKMGDLCYHRQLCEIAYFFDSQKVSLKTALFPFQD
jgi:hypothetical protein